MKQLLILIAIASFITFTTNYSQDSKPKQPTQHGKNFVDKNGDGYNDNAPDHDGDGIPNGLDPDFKGPKMQKHKFVDLDGDGIKDNADNGMKKGIMNKGGKGFGKKNMVNENNNTEKQAGQSKARGMMYGKKK